MMSEEFAVIKSTKTQLEDFIAGEGSFIWEDICNELSTWVERQEASYKNCSSMKELGEVNGRLEALAYFKTLPNVLIEALEEAGRNHSSENVKPEELEEDI